MQRNFRKLSTTCNYVSPLAIIKRYTIAQLSKPSPDDRITEYLKNKNQICRVETFTLTRANYLIPTSFLTRIKTATTGKIKQNVGTGGKAVNSVELKSLLKRLVRRNGKRVESIKNVYGTCAKQDIRGKASGDQPMA